ncbi:DUF1850 domain-containing protein [Pseudothermotoga sp.]
MKAFLLCALLSLLSCHYVLVVERQGQVIFEKILCDGKFTIVFVHSVEKTLVEECFTIEPDGSLILFEARYTSYGAGLPSDAEGGFAFEDGKFLLKLHRKFERITLRVSHVEGHGILFSDGTVWFKDIANVNDALTIYVKVLPSLKLKIF